MRDTLLRHPRFVSSAAKGRIFSTLPPPSQHAEKDTQAGERRLEKMNVCVCRRGKFGYGETNWFLSTAAAVA